tara:strand:+ start:4842 stop:5063 length:222 start_codon:yes stop_codon:yes gene_type:complete
MEHSALSTPTPPVASDRPTDRPTDRPMRSLVPRGPSSRAIAVRGREEKEDDAENRLGRANDVARVLVAIHSID